MKPIVAVLVLLVTTLAFASDEWALSKYKIPNNSFKLVQRTDGREDGIFASFSGRAVLRGVLVIVFDRTPGHPEEDQEGTALFKPNLSVNTDLTRKAAQGRLPPR